MGLSNLILAASMVFPTCSNMFPYICVWFLRCADVVMLLSLFSQCVSYTVTICSLKLMHVHILSVSRICPTCLHGLTTHPLHVDYVLSWKAIGLWVPFCCMLSENPVDIFLGLLLEYNVQSGRRSSNATGLMSPYFINNAWRDAKNNYAVLSDTFISK